ncbi:MAG: prevent-host-death protein [Terracidiphilus sp.]|jgi:PHD/YefM family antitoxin component YafN of YafNO toxin-antitoxin module
METQRVGIREFRDKLASYLLESDKALAITRHGDTIGYYLPARRKRSEAEKEALRQAGERMQRMMEASGVTEDEIIEDFKQWRKEGRK